ncbi:AMP-dependent synthetase and ligase [Amycolicicoccus subflavus DQS3-9A1] [Mycobacterium shimoidei]|uniref:AMP-dependent synthetase and ligase [Amycolicicoccus subflavus DQS3-9A1] n=1 Tax=Mycobacterium shimoidei TaxID=29313 RepID=A0A375Z1U8_MYCSH|nr:SRPBCC family protein [Mycobacterium shimoidei]SRX95154.1 AMP-dependent synthetase and ligase [Amycolicicoccus subflavus DQS3-9A1] [Mycobacterium shimoidei]
MRVERRCVIDADRGAVWKIVSDPDCYPTFMTSLERWESANDQPAGVGARYTVHWKIGSVPVGGLIEVVEFDERRDLAWVGITGVNLRGRIRLRDGHDGQTKVTFRLSYQAPGGILGYIADRVAVRQVGRNAARTLERLKALAEA